MCNFRMYCTRFLKLSMVFNCMRTHIFYRKLTRLDKVCKMKVIGEEVCRIGNIVQVDDGRCDLV